MAANPTETFFIEQGLKTGKRRMSRPDWRSRLARAFARADLGRVPLLDAAGLLCGAVPDYAAHRYEGSGRDNRGVRWFESPQLALAHAIWAATHRPYDPSWRVVDVVGELTMSPQGWWTTLPRHPAQTGRPGTPRA